MRKTLKKHWKDLLLIIFILFLFSPYGKPIKVGVNKIIAPVRTFLFSVEEDDYKTLNHYNWLLTDTNGQQLNFSELKNQVVFINVWATWCPPCIAEMPNLEQLYQAYGDEVSFLFVAQDHKEAVDKFLKKQGYNLPVYFEQSAAPEELQVSSLPTTFIINRQGEVVVHKIGAMDWNSSKIHELLDKYIKKTGH